MRSGRFQSESRLEEGGAYLERGGEWQSGARQEEEVRCVAKEGSGRDGGSSGLGATGGGAFHLARGVAGGRGGRRQRQHPRRGRTSAGPATRIRGNDDRDGEDRRHRDDGDSRGRGLSAETWAAIRPSGSKVRLGTKFAIEDSSSDRDDGSNFSDEGDSDSISDDPEQRRQRGPGQQRQRRRQRGRWRVVEGGRRERRPRGTAPQTATQDGRTE